MWYIKELANKNLKIFQDIRKTTCSYCKTIVTQATENEMIQVKFPKLTKIVDNFPNLMGPGPCTKKDSDSPGKIPTHEQNRFDDFIFFLKCW